MVFEKPHGLFEATLYMSAQLQLPTPGEATADGDAQKLRLVKGVVQAGEPKISAGADGGNETRLPPRALPPATRVRPLGHAHTGSTCCNCESMAGWS